MAIPLWKDKIVTLSGTGTFNIRLNNASGAIIYSGKAEAIGGTRKVRINDICADYIYNNLPRFGETYGGNFTTTFCIEQSGASVEIVTFYANWSYDYDFVDTPSEGAEGIALNVPIRKEVPYAARIPFCFVNLAGTYVTLQRQGTEAAQIAPYNPNQFNSFVNDGAPASMLGASLLTAPVRMYLVYAVNGYNRACGAEYIGKTSCDKYAIYYINAYGGWDVLTIEGNTRISRAFSRVVSRREYNNTFESAEGQITAVNEQTRKFTFNTGWVDDLGASRMHHLLGTTKAYLCEIATLKMVPITITDTAAEVRTHRMDGMMNYTINAEIAQSFVRR